MQSPSSLLRCVSIPNLNNGNDFEYIVRTKHKKLRAQVKMSPADHFTKSVAMAAVMSQSGRKNLMFSQVMIERFFVP